MDKSKPKILTFRDQYLSIWTDWIRPLASKHIELYWVEDGLENHSPLDSVIMLRRNGNNFANLLEKYRTLGYRVIVEHIWDQYVTDITNVEDGVMHLYCAAWFWYNSSLLYQHFGYDKYQRIDVPDKLFLMLMNKQKAHRDGIYEQLNSILNDSIYSYVARGKMLDKYTWDYEPEWVFYAPANWYNNTKFSVCVETTEYGPNPCVTEKAIKPMAFNHPTVVWGTVNTLKWIRSQGFETFGHCVDESYDSIADNKERLDKVCKEIFKLHDQWKQTGNVFNDTLTQEILIYNRNRFYDTALVEKGLEEHIFNDIVEFCESQ